MFFDGVFAILVICSKMTKTPSVFAPVSFSLEI